MTADTRIRIFNSQVRGANGSWSEDGFSIAHPLIKKVVGKVASKLEGYIQSLGLADKFDIVDRFDREGCAWIEGYLRQPDHELDSVESKITSLRAEIFEKLSRHLKIVDAISKGNKLQPLLGEDNSKMISALSKLMASAENIELELDFQGHEKMVIPSIKPVVGYVIEEQKKQKVASGMIRYYDDDYESVTLSHIDDMRGNLTLRVKTDSMRRTLLAAQTERRKISVTYIPHFHSLNPDQEMKEGVLVEILSDGSEQTILNL